MRFSAVIFYDSLCLDTSAPHEPLPVIRTQQLQGEVSRADKGQLQLPLPAQAAHLGKHSLQGEMLAVQHQVIKSTIRSAPQDFKDVF
jgi:hypothetical protein